MSGSFYLDAPSVRKTSELCVRFTLGVCPLGRIEEKNGISLPGGILLGMGMPFPWILIL